MSLKCPHCGSYNTEAVISNWVGRDVINRLRATGASVSIVASNSNKVNELAK